MKVAPLLRAFLKYPALDVKLIHTGQHYDDALSKAFFDDLGIRAPDAQLAIATGTPTAQTAETLRAFEAVLARENPEAVLVVGDVTSTLACALATAKHVLPTPFYTTLASASRTRPLLLHVEAGLRSHDLDMPEETNRRLTDALADALFVTEPAGLANLAREGVPAERTHYVGNVMIDSLLAARARADASAVLERLALTPNAYGLVTLHRPSNVDDASTFASLAHTLDGIARSLPLVFPMHPRTRARAEAAGVAFDPARITVTEPLGYFDFLKLMANARVVLTDSGGVQEETTVLGIRCITLRENTERPVTVDEGTNLLAGTSREGVERAFAASMVASASRHTVTAPRFWDGHAAERICDVVSGLFSHRDRS